MIELQHRNIVVTVADVDKYAIIHEQSYRDTVYQLAEQQLADRMKELPKLPLGYMWQRNGDPECTELTGCDRLSPAFSFRYKFVSTYNKLHRKQRRKESRRRWAAYCK